MEYLKYGLVAVAAILLLGSVGCSGKCETKDDKAPTEAGSVDAPSAVTPSDAVTPTADVTPSSD